MYFNIFASIFIMSFSAILLGISSSTPTKDRNTVSLAVKYNGEVFLFDTAEGVQQQLMKTKTSYMDINNIFISHFHADHFLGLPGLIATMSLHERQNPIYIYGPKGIEERVNNILESFEIFPKFELRFKILRSGAIYEDKNIVVKAKRVNHGIENYGFRIEEKDTIGKFVREKAEKLGIPEGPLYSQLKSGKEVEYKGKIIKPEQVMDYGYIKKGRVLSYLMDLLDSDVLDLVKDSDLVFHEACFTIKDKEQSRKTKHSVAAEVAKTLDSAKVKRWILANFSARYKNLESTLNEARQYFPNSEIGEELKEYEI